MKSYSSREVIKALKADGWYEVNCVGSHHQYKHRTKPGRVTVKDPDKDIPRATLNRIEQQSGLKFRRMIGGFSDEKESSRPLFLSCRVHL